MSFVMVPSGEMKSLTRSAFKLFSRWLVPFISSIVVFFYVSFFVGGMNIKVFVMSCLVHLFYS